MDKGMTKKFAEALVKSAVEVDYTFEVSQCKACNTTGWQPDTINHKDNCAYVEAKEYLKSIE